MEPIAPSKPKRDFLPQLGLVEGQRESEAIYDKMMAEARAAYDKLSRDRNALKREFRDDLVIQPPFTTSQLSPAAVRAQVGPVYWAASAATKEQYDKGFHYIQVEGKQEQDNWVIQWCIFHTFRHVNKHVDTFRQQAANAAAAAAALGGSDASAGERGGDTGVFLNGLDNLPVRDFRAEQATASPASQSSPSTPGFSVLNRPAGRRPTLTSRPSQTMANAPESARHESRSPSLLPYDPVRDDGGGARDL